ncbi:MAG TPA: trypsin-like peptidase domain-containing protein, partial [Candidatus Saccharimonadales bacterium]
FIWSIRKANPFSLAFMILGFFITLVITGYLLPKILPIHDPSLKVIVNGNLVLVLSLYAGLKGYDLGKYLKVKVKNRLIKKLAQYLFLTIDLCFGLIVIWLVATMIGRLPFEATSNSVNDSIIVQSLENSLPPVPTVFSFIDSKINPNDQPIVFLRTKIQTQVEVPINSKALVEQANIDQKSVVRVTSFGCGGIISGSGYIAAPDLIITNAHVIAGADRPIIKYLNQSYAGNTVLFNPALDIAAIMVKGLKAAPLQLYKGSVAINQNVAILGYPGGNFTVLPGQISDEQFVSSPNIYQVGSFNRQIYAINADLQPGNSGGPVIATNGQVIGLVFAKSDVLSNDGFAITSYSMSDVIKQAISASHHVSSGACVAG